MSQDKYSKQILLRKIKEKKEFSALPDELIQEYIAKNIKKIPSNLGKKDIKILIKKVRADLHLLTGRFQKGRKNRQNLLVSEKFSELLKTHTSTAERLEFYPQIKKAISVLNPNSILDLGCGLNPIALASKKYIYFATDIRGDELEIIQNFARSQKFRIKTSLYDISKIKSNLPKTDICLVFKVLDIIKNNRQVARDILTKVNSKHFIISFSTIKLSGKQMLFPERKWFEKILSDLKLKHKKLSIPNEIFYIITHQ